MMLPSPSILVEICSEVCRLRGEDAHLRRIVQLNNVSPWALVFFLCDARYIFFLCDARYIVFLCDVRYIFFLCDV